MRFLAPLVVCAFALACSPGGTGIGTSPDASEPCPSTPPESDADCSKQFPRGKVCCYALGIDTCGLVAFCPGGATAKWDVQKRGDGGTLVDAPLDTVEAGADADAAADAEAAADAFDSSDSDDVIDAPPVDAVDAVDASDAAETSDDAEDAPTG